MTTDVLLTELERQRRYLERLPKDYSFPVFNARVALESMRKSAYKDTASASREIVDNAIEAGSDQIDIVFREEPGDKGRVVVTAVAFVDNGPGMLPGMMRFALSWGGGTHYDDPKYLGKYGFGLPNSSINQTRYTSVYSRTTADGPIFACSLNLDHYSEWGVQSVPEPAEGALPEFVEDYLKKNRRAFERGTVVVWEKPDRLSVKRGANLAEHLLDDFGVVYRYLLSNPERRVRIVIRGTPVKPVHPLFLDPKGLYYLAPIDNVEEPSGGGARLIEDRLIPVRYWEDAATGERHLDKVEDLDNLDPDDAGTRAIGTIQVQIARLPVDFATDRGGDDDQKRRFRIRKTRRGMSFVRAGREIETVDVFPKDKESQGLGEWPLLQTFAYHWGIEVKFSPQLDEVFGITNDKQGVRPIEDFWRVLAAEGLDDLARRENRWQEEARKLLRKRKIAEAEEQRSDTPSPAEAAAADADVAGSHVTQPPDRSKAGAGAAVEEEAEKQAASTGRQKAEIREALLKESQKRQYRLDFFESANGPFYEPAWFGASVIVKVNRAHPFYSVLYQKLEETDAGPLAKQAVDVLLFALARAELTVPDATMEDWYRAQRRDRWSPFLEDALKSLARRLDAKAGGAVEEELVDERTATPNSEAA